MRLLGWPAAIFSRVSLSIGFVRPRKMQFHPQQAHLHSGRPDWRQRVDDLLQLDAVPELPQAFLVLLAQPLLRPVEPLRPASEFPDLLLVELQPVPRNGEGQLGQQVGPLVRTQMTQRNSMRPKWVRVVVASDWRAW